MADSGDIDNALVAKLGADPTLLALCPNGVYWDVSPPGSTRFVIVSHVDEADVPQFGSRAFEDALYAVEVRMLSTVAGAPSGAKAAAARIDVLLENGAMTVPGYALMTMHRESRWKKTEADEADPSILWFRRGGNYRLMMSTA
jgi:hypothetical protein